MSELNSQLRLMWLEGINASSSNGTKGIANLFDSRNLQIAQITIAPSFELTLSFQHEWDDLIDSFANDAKRFTSAAIETAAAIKSVPKLPKSTSWALIQLYYGAFYAAHGLARLWGGAITQLLPEHIRMIKLAANAQGYQDVPLKTGLHFIYASPNDKHLRISPTPESNSHECLWSFFVNLLVNAQNKINNESPATPNKQTTLAKLIEIQLSLSNFQAGPNDKWMSSVRNAINYRHLYGVWHPYRDAKKDIAKILFERKPWLDKVEEINFWQAHPDKQLSNFVHACSAIISMCRESCVDMYERCPSGKNYSFQRYGAIGLLNKLKQN